MACLVIYISITIQHIDSMSCHEQAILCDSTYKLPRAVRSQRQSASRGAVSRDRRGGSCHLRSVKSQSSRGRVLGIGCVAAGRYLT